MERDQEDGNKMISTIFNYTENGSMVNIQLTRKYEQTLMEIDF